ncbi:aliphatic sulfonate ABC transporter substrate-binding protein [Burkholderia sp. WTPI3]|uniref:aliphatic sulfonate ABC transporter substrate-binding protein n=1 Tax=Burkholderia sp. WTPI3 TaxID=2822167 RepID=UPI001F43C585|nr:aliphatic sulfonate ABC transporter substrate-binding protein [Burkholderia sp. WTPI3]
MTPMNRRAFTRAMLAAGLSAAGIRAHAESTPSVLRIGYQKSSTLITLLKTRNTLEQSLAPLGLRVSWHEFASGLPLTEALNVGAVDFSADVADTVPVFAQAAHARFVYVAQEAPSPKAQAIIVKKDSTLHTLADLKGKRIAVTKAAGSHYLLLAALARTQLAPADTAIHYLTPADGRAAFERGSVDAWITWDLCRVGRLKSGRADSGRRQQRAPSYQRYYLASSGFAAARPDVMQIVFDQLSQAGAWLRAHPQEAANTLAPIWGLDAPTIARANARRSYLVRTVVAQNFGEQQKIADTFLAAGLLPARIDTSEALRWNFTSKRADPIGA